jgi:hypothetical protein
MPHDVFISHSTDDKLVALALCNKLESAGVRCWIAPRDVGPGAEWGKAIVDAISGCRLMVLVFSSKAHESRHIRREVQTAFEKDLIVIPFRVENTQPTGTMEYYLGSVHWLDALTPPVENHLMGVVERVKALLPAAAQEPASPSQQTQSVEIIPSEPRKVPRSEMAAPPVPATSATGSPVTKITSSPGPAPSTIDKKASSSVTQKGARAKRLIILASLAGVVLLGGRWILRVPAEANSSPVFKSSRALHAEKSSGVRVLCLAFSQ